MRLIEKIKKAIDKEFGDGYDCKKYIEKWQKTNEGSNYGDYWENFHIVLDAVGEIMLEETLHKIDPHTLLQMAVDMGVETPDFIPSIATFKNEIKASYQTSVETFEKALRCIHEHPDVAISLANSALESIIKEILKDDKLHAKPSDKKTLYALTQDILREFQIFPKGDCPIEIKEIGSSLIAASQGIEKLRSSKTMAHGKTNDDYLVNDPMYAFFVINSVATIGLFLKSFYDNKFKNSDCNNDNDSLPF